jgi:hypothetical protein
VNELAADGTWETYEAGRPAGMSVDEWAARDTEWERQFEAAATAAKDQRLADERAADEEAHERALAEEVTPGQAGAQAAEEVITRQADAGMGVDEIDRHQGDTAAELLSSATTGEGKAFARSYDITAAILTRDLGEPDLPGPNTPHPDPGLAARGWQTCEHPGHGIYVRRDPEIELEAS